MNKLFTLICLFSILFSFSQKDLEKKTNSLIASDNFQTFRIEKFFLHTNKSVYFSGEKIWFKAYIVNDDTDLPSLETTNLYVNLYNSNKSLINSKLFYVENGMTSGELDLEKTLPSGTYYLQLDTKWNQNFKTGSIFTIDVENLNGSANENNVVETSTQQNNSDELQLKNKPVITFYPESQTLLKDVQNMITFSTNKNVKGKVINDNTGKQVAALRSNDLGIGAFKVMQNSNFSAELDIEGETIKIPLPKASEKGFIIHKITGNYNANVINFELNTNEETLKDYAQSYVFAVLHRSGSIKSVAPLKLEKEILDYKISFLKENIFNGLNTITLFNEDNEPISERNFYWKTNNIADIEFITDKKEGDSLYLNVNLLNKSIPVDLSISVLPKDSKVYYDKYSILSSFLLSPYLADNLPINKPNALSNSKMDFLLQSLEFNDPFPYKNLKNNSLANENENGITLEGTVNASIENPKSYSVMLTSKVNNLLLVQPLNKDKTFEFNQLLLKHPTRYQLSLLDKKGQITKAKFFVFNSYTDYKANPQLDITAIQNRVLKTNETKHNVNTEFDLSLPEFDDVEQLDEVIIKADKIKESQETQKKLSKAGVQGMAFSKIYEPRKSPYAKGDILQFFRTIPGVTVKYTQDNTPYLNNERFRKTLNNTGDAPFTIILDGSPLGTDLSVIDFRLASEFEYIVVNFRGGGYGALFPQGVINMVTLKGNNGERVSKPNPDIQINDTKFGFNIPQSRYEKPIFQFPNYKAKENFESLDWIPNFTVNPKIYNKLRINVEDANGVKLIVNGLSANGDLIYKVIVLN